MRLHALIAAAAALAMLAPAAQGTVIDQRDAAVDGADRLLEIQFEDGAFPWRVGLDGKYQNVQGVTAQGLLDAYKVTADQSYLDAAGDNADWLITYMEEHPDAFSSGPNQYFLAELAVLSQDTTRLDMAREAFQRAVNDERWADTPTALAEAILEGRAQNYGNLGLWDVGLFVRAAQDIGNTSAADEIATVLVEQATEQTIVDPYDETASSYEIGLTGLLFGLAEADVVGHQAVLDKTASALEAEQMDNGGFGPSDIGEGDAQVTAYAALGLIAVGHLDTANAACDWLVTNQDADGGWSTSSGDEYGETNSEGVQALSTCVLPARNGAVAYGNAAVPGI